MAEKWTVLEMKFRYQFTSWLFSVAAKTIGVNPKINNMNQGYKAAKYDLLWICDSNIKGNTVFFVSSI